MLAEEGEWWWGRRVSLTQKLCFHLFATSIINHPILHPVDQSACFRLRNPVGLALARFLLTCCHLRGCNLCGRVGIAHMTTSL